MGQNGVQGIKPEILFEKKCAVEILASVLFSPISEQLSLVKNILFPDKELKNKGVGGGGRTGGEVRGVVSDNYFQQLYH